MSVVGAGALASGATSRIARYDETYLHRDDRYLQARIYRPAGDGPFPVLVGVHGGAWCSGNRRTNERLDLAVARAGVLVVALDFRQPPAAGYPGSVADVAAGIAWTRDNAERFGGDVSRIGGLGTSTGGHLLLLTALRPDDPRWAAGPPLDRLALCWPIVNPLGRYRWAARSGLDKLVSRHDSYWRDEQAMADGDPLEMFRDARVTAPTLPTGVLVQGAEDENIPKGMTEEFVAAFRAAGGCLEMCLFDGQPHGFITRDPTTDASRAAIDLVVELARSPAPFHQITPSTEEKI